ncbi:MAG: histone deacetylase [Vulcanimicrobiota bacterium]
MIAYYCDHFVLPLPEAHRFPMAKYRLLRERLTGHPQLTLEVPVPASDQELLLAHTQDYLDSLKTGNLPRQEVRRLGFPYSPELVERSRRSVGATIAACRTALDQGLAANLAGGTHHAFADHPEGFCVFNDSVVALRVMQAEGRLERALVIDCDVHQGNGTAALAANDPSIFAFSIHGEKNFPFRKVPGDLDVALPDATDDEIYLARLAPALEEAFRRSRPQLAIYLSGADPYHGDKLGRLSLTKAGLGRRDQLVLGRCRQLGLPVAVTMGGGYAPDPEDIVDIHAQTVTIAAALWAGQPVSAANNRPCSASAD